MLAKALYDNKAECPDELAFRKGDILMVLEQNVVGSEGWWNCSLHGRQGLAPANRLQVLASTPMDVSPSYAQPASLRRKENLQNIYQVPTTSRSPRASVTYEEMDSLYQTPTSSPPLAKEVYQVPASSPARLLCDRTRSSTNQQLYTLPRACRASGPSPVTGPQSEVYDVPSPQRRGSLLPAGCATPPSIRKASLPVLPTEHFRQLIYDIPPSPERVGMHHEQDSNAGNVYDVPPTAGKDFAEKLTEFEALFPGHYKTLPNPRKSDWIYDVPVSPENTGVNKNQPTLPPIRPVVYDTLPVRHESSPCYNVLSSNAEGKAGSSQIYDVPPVQKIQSVSCQPVYDVPASRDVSFSRQNGNYNVPPTCLNKMEHQSSKQNIYDVPKGSPAAPKMGNYSVRNSAYESQIYNIPPPLPRDYQSLSLSLEQDRLSVASTESRASTFSMSSSTSRDSFSTSSSSSDESAKEVTLKLDEAIERLSQLQHRVASAIASLMIYVSSKWRFREHLEENIEEIHRSADSIKESLAEFLDFARGVKGNATHLTDNNLQMKINKQLQIIAESYQILLETREGLNNCNWSLNVLVVSEPQSSPDNLDRFVMVARTIPDDIKRFVSIIIANGKLLFKNHLENDEDKSPKHLTISRHWSTKDIHDKEKTSPFTKPTESKGNVNNSMGVVIEECEYVPSQKKEFEKMLNLSLHRRVSRRQQSEAKMKPDPELAHKNASDTEPEKNRRVSQTQETPPSEKHSNQNAFDTTNRVALSEHCRLYFGALQKATGVFTNSLCNNQPPEVFIGHSKLIIMVGQKLVDSLCRQVQENDARNDILCRSSQLCTLLKNLAVATKTAAIHYPDQSALQELQEQAKQLAQETQKFRSTLD